MENAIINIKGMTCQGCVKSATNSINALPGINKVNINLAKNTCEIFFDKNKVTLEKIIEAIEDLGFDASV